MTNNLNVTATETGTFLVEMTTEQIKEMNYCLNLVANQRRIARDYQFRKRDELKAQRDKAKAERVKVEKVPVKRTHKDDTMFSIMLPETNLPETKSQLTKPITTVLPPKVPSPTLKIIN